MKFQVAILLGVMVEETTMNREQMIARFYQLYDEPDRCQIEDWADAVTEGDTVLVPLNYVDDLCLSEAKSLGLVED